MRRLFERNLKGPSRRIDLKMDERLSLHLHFLCEERITFGALDTGANFGENRITPLEPRTGPGPKTDSGSFS